MLVERVIVVVGHDKSHARARLLGQEVACRQADVVCAYADAVFQRRVACWLGEGVGQLAAGPESGDEGTGPAPIELS